MLEINQIYNADCLEKMKDIPDGSVDMICTDLPYGYIESKWDNILPIDELWKQYKRLLVPNGIVALFGNEPFASTLRLSNIEWYRYDWYWLKNRFANFAQAPYMPLKIIETISIFSEGNIAPNSKLKMKYYPQGLQDCHKEIIDRPCSKAYRPNRKPQSFTQTKSGYPKQLLQFNKDKGENLHPTQKPVALLQYLIRTYTNEGETVLDSCCGSGTTAIAAIREKRNFICIEREEKFFNIASKRIENELQQLTLF